MESYDLSHLHKIVRTATPPRKAYRNPIVSNDYEAANPFDDTVPLVDSKYDATTQYESKLQDDPKPQSMPLPPKRGRLQGWKFGLIVATTSTICILVLNIAVAIKLSRVTRPDGIGTVSNGSCKTVARFSAIIHVAINVLGTLLLGASNYTMQCLSSPTRQDIDNAHLREDWLDIGVVGIRNVLGRIPRIRSVFWTLLATTSIPIHLLYNSSFFRLNYVTNHQIAAVTPHFLIDGDFALNVTAWPDVSRADLQQTKDWMTTHAGNADLVRKRTAYDCTKDYGGLATDSGSVLIVVEVNDTRSGNDLVYYDGFNVAHGAIPWNITAAENATADPKVMLEYHNVSYCLSTIVEARCVLQASVHILATIIFCNFIKVCAMLWTLLYQKEATIVTVGDAVASFLANPDPTTEGRCWMDKHDAVSGSAGGRTGAMPPTPRNTGRRAPPWEAASVGRWTMTGGLGAAIFIIPLYYAGYGGRQGGGERVLSEGRGGLGGIIFAAMAATFSRPWRPTRHN